MRLPSPSVEASPQPVKYNDTDIKELRPLTWQTAADQRPTKETMLIRCEKCKELFVLSEGTVFLDEFLCDDDYSRIARDAGFYIGR